MKNALRTMKKDKAVAPDKVASRSLEVHGRGGD